MPWPLRSLRPPDRGTQSLWSLEQGSLDPLSSVFPENSLRAERRRRTFCRGPPHVSTQDTIKLLDLTNLHAPIHDELMVAIEKVVRSGRYALGEEVEAFEKELSSYTGAKHAVGCGSGSDALLLALQAANVGPGDEVICPAYSFFSTASVIARLGASPVFVDVDPESLNLSPELTRRASRECDRLRALLPVDIFGRVGAIKAFTDLGEEIGVPVIEDAAQALGARDEDGMAAGTRTQMGCISFYPTKNIGAMGEAGVILTSDTETADRLRALRNHGQTLPNHFSDLGINSRLDAIQAAILRVKLRKLPEWLAAREDVAASYDRLFSEAGALSSERKLEEAEIPMLYPARPAHPAQPAHHQYTIRVAPEIREALRLKLTFRGIETGIYYPMGLHEQPALSKMGRCPLPLPETETATRQVLSLPCHPGVDASARARVVEGVVDEIKALCQR